MRLKAEEIREHYDYDPIHGQLIRRTGKGRVPGSRGCKRERGYIKISFMNKSYLAHRMIWLWRYGTIDGECIDHINGDTGDNRLHNLRTCTLSDNQHNQHRNRNEIKSSSK